MGVPVPMLPRLLPLLLLASCAPAPIGAAALADDVLRQAFGVLHEPIVDVYRVGIDRDGLHELLAASFHGEALTREYVEHFSTLHRMARDETSINVLRVDYETVTVLDRGRDTVRVEADWSVGGVVTHQGHKHPRVNRYRAVYTLAEVGAGLRIIGTKLRNLQRVGSLLQSDDWPLDDLPSSGGGFLDPLDYLEAGLGAAPSAANEPGSADPATIPPADRTDPPPPAAPTAAPPSGSLAPDDPTAP